MAVLSDLGKKVRNTVRRNSQAFLRLEEDVSGSVEYDYTNMGRFMNASFASDSMASSGDQDGRESAQLFEITVTFALMQTSNTELALLEQLAIPDPGSIGLYQNGHTLYFSGSNQVTTTDVQNALDTTTGEIDFATLSDPQGIVFENVLLKPAPEIDLSGDESSIGLEFTGMVETQEMNSLDNTQKIVISPE